MSDSERRADDSVLASEVVARKVKWLGGSTGERFPLGAISVIAGRPDQGKGLLATHVAADVSRRGGAVIYSAVEDDPGLMTRPRLESAGADLDSVHLWRFMLPEQTDELAANVERTGAKLVILDPFNAHLGSGVHRQSDSIRKVTTPLSAIAERFGCAVLIVEHALKRVSRDAHPLSAIGGSSSGLPAASRMAFIFGTDPADADRRILACVKHNLRDKPPALSFETDAEEIGLVGEVPNLVCQGECEFDPKRLLGDVDPGKQGRKPDKRAAANQWLAEYLIGKDNKAKGGMVLEDAKQHGHSKNTVRRAADELGVVKSGKGGPNVTWSLPQEFMDAYNAGQAS